MKDLEIFFSSLFVCSPVIGFIPQIYTNQIVFPEFLSALTILANILKIFHFKGKPVMYSVIPLQGLFTIFLHFFLLYFNKGLYSFTEEKIMKRLRISSRQVYLSYITLICLITQITGLIFKSFEFCGILSLIFEVSVNFIQLLIEKQNKDVIEVKKKKSQKELYLVWIVGDICRILFMMSVEAPYVYTVASFMQLGIDGYLLYN